MSMPGHIVDQEIATLKARVAALMLHVAALEERLESTEDLLVECTAGGLVTAEDFVQRLDSALRRLRSQREKD